MSRPTIVRKGRMAVRQAPVLRLFDEDGVRCAEVSPCPFCGGSHVHAVPVDTLRSARLERIPKCNTGGSVYTLELPDELVGVDAPAVVGGPPEAASG